MKRTFPRLLGLFLLTALAGCGKSAPTRSIDFLPLKSIEITSQNPQAAAGTTNRFTAIGHFGDATTFQFTRDITSEVTWESSDTSVLSFSSDPSLAGFATAGVAGTVTVTATANSDPSISQPYDFTVTNATISSLSIAQPATTTLVAGETLQLQAKGTFSDNSTQDLTEAADWKSSDTSIATVGNTVPGRGLVSGLAQGTVDITASFDGQSDTQTLDVSGPTLESIAVTAEGSASKLAQGTTLQLTATGTYSDGSTADLTDMVTWDSSDTTVATIDQNAGTTGLLAAGSIGSTSVTATFGNVTSSALTITVSSATLSSLTITPSSSSISVGNTVELTATGDFSDGSTQDVTRDVTWSSDAPSVATVSVSTGMEGTVKGVAAGTATISAGANAIPVTAGATINPSVDVTVQ